MTSPELRSHEDALVERLLGALFLLTAIWLLL